MAKNSLLYLKNKIKTSLMYYPPAPESPRQKALNIIAMLFLTVVAIRIGYVLSEMLGR